MIKPIKPHVLIALQNLFQKKKWEISEDSVGDMGLFLKFCERLRLFSVEEQQMLIELSEDFVRIGIQDYLEKFFDSFILLGDTFFDRFEKIYVLPLISPYVKGGKSTKKTVRGKSKSADFLHYLLDASEWRWFSKKLIPNINFKNLLEKFDPSNSCIVLIDDFVGTGKTAKDVCDVFMAEKFPLGVLSPEHIKVVSIAAQERGIKYVKKELQIDVVSNITIRRGISDKFTSKELDEKLFQMKSMESKLAIPSDIHLGFEESEAMITFLNKTPNNTFPVYWHETRSRVAPFPRYKKYNA